MDNGSIAVITGHVLACTYQFIFTLLAIIELCGLNVLGRIGCVVVLVLAFIFDLIEVILVHTLGKTSSKTDKQSQALAYWHVILNILITILIAVFFGNQQYELLQEIATFNGLGAIVAIVETRWLAIMVIIVAGWMCEVQRILQLVLS